MKGNKPVYSEKAKGLEVAVFENEGKEFQGKKSTFLTASLSRSYKDKDGEWATTSSLRVNDLPIATMLLSRAFEFAVLKTKTADVE